MPLRVPQDKQALPLLSWSGIGCGGGVMALSDDSPFWSLAVLSFQPPMVSIVFGLFGARFKSPQTSAILMLPRPIEAKNAIIKRNSIQTDS
jgi:hypothetical protein